MNHLKELPKFHETFIPILKVLSNGEILHRNDLRRLVHTQFYADLPQNLLEQKTKDGSSILYNRIGWGITYLKQAELVEQPERAMVRATPRGLEFLKRGSLNRADLTHDPIFQANRKVVERNLEPEDVSLDSSPQDLIDNGFKIIESQAKTELLSKLKKIDPYYFEKVVLLLLKKMGYGDFILTKKSGDGGIDGIINEDQLGLDNIYIQTKRYTENKIRETEIRNFIGSISGDTNKGIFVTTSSFDEKAVQKAKTAPQKIVLVDGEMLVDLMYKHCVGVQVRSTYEVKEVDGDFFEDV